MSAHGYPDYQRYAQWLGPPLAQATALAIGAGSHTDGPFPVPHYASVVLAIKPTGGQITATIKQTVQGGPVSLVLSTQVVIAAGATLFESFVLFGSSVELDLQGSAGGETVDYALYPSNTTTNAQVITQATINVQQNEVLIAAEPTVDFVDAGQNKLVVTDDAANTRVKITPPKIIAGSVTAAGGIAAGTGFTVARTAVGKYTITFTVAFAAAPVVVATPLIAGGAEWLQLNGLPTTTQAFIDITQLAGGAVNFFNDDFHFFAFAVS